MTIDTTTFPTLSDADWQTVTAAVMAEIQRRNTLSAAVQSVTDTTRQYVDAGGDSAALVTAVQQAAASTPETPAA